MIVLNASDRTEPFQGIDVSARPAEWTDPVRRFAAYRAMEQGRYDLALELFDWVAKREPKDYLAEALAYMNTQRPDRAEETLDRALRVKWGNIDFDEIVILHALLDSANRVRPLTLFDQDYLQELRQQVGDFNVPASGKELSVGHFCTLER